MESHKGIFYPTESRDSCGVIKSLLSGRIWERRIVELYKTIVKKGDIVLDCGAFIGLHTLELSKLVEDTGKVYSFEPIPAVADCVEKTMEEKNINNVVLVRKPLYSSSNIKLEFVSDLSGLSSVADYRRKAFKYKYKVNSICIDDFINIPKDKKISFIKIDVEGSEFKVLEGAIKTIKKYRPTIIFETWKNKRNIQKLANWCMIHQYTMTYISCDNYVLDPIY
jgi:FkbM family methyltransferase